MEEQSQSLPEALPQSATPEFKPEMPVQPQPQVSPVTARKPPIKILLAIVFIVIVTLVIVLMGSRRMTTGPIDPGITISVTPTPTGVAISNRQLSPFATESAFMQFESSVESLPKIIQNAVLQDPTVLPPVLDLPLGF